MNHMTIEELRELLAANPNGVDFRCTLPDNYLPHHAKIKIQCCGKIIFGYSSRDGKHHGTMPIACLEDFQTSHRPDKFEQALDHIANSFLISSLRAHNYEESVSLEEKARAFYHQHRPDSQESKQ